MVVWRCQSGDFPLLQLGAIFSSSLLVGLSVYYFPWEEKQIPWGRDRITLSASKIAQLPATNDLIYTTRHKHACCNDMMKRAHVLYIRCLHIACAFVSFTGHEECESVSTGNGAKRRLLFLPEWQREWLLANWLAKLMSQVFCQFNQGGLQHSAGQKTWYG